MANKVAQAKIMTEMLKPATADFSRFLQKAEKDVYAGKINVISVRDLETWLNHFGSEIVEKTIIKRRTLMRRKSRNEKLSEAETDRALRMARITIEAERVFGNPKLAGEWLSRNNHKFNGQPPYALLQSDLGASLVEETLVQIDHGMFA
jgi:putative toxin-antitoxin system antitoxin component (TIGR02293 family)